MYSFLLPNVICYIPEGAYLPSVERRASEVATPVKDEHDNPEKATPTLNDERRGTINRLDARTINHMIRDLLVEVNCIRLHGDLVQSVILAAKNLQSYITHDKTS